MEGRRAQVFTLEAVFAALVVIAGLVFALQAIVLTPSTSGAADQPTGAAELNDALASAAASGQLKHALLYWDEGGDGFHRSSSSGEDFRYYIREDFTSVNVHPFVESLDRLIGDSEQMNVLLHYRETDGTIGTRRMVDQGAPGQNAVRASVTVVLYDTDKLRNPSNDPTDPPVTVADAASTSGKEFYAPDAGPDDTGPTGPSGDGSGVFNVVEVEVVVWER